MEASRQAGGTAEGEALPPLEWSLLRPVSRPKMRKAAAILVVLAVAMILPVVSIAGACGPKPPCCKASQSEDARLTRGSCCAPASCASSTVEEREGNTPWIELGSIDARVRV